MSYLERPRLVFSGRFQADVSTVNNDVRHYANGAFEERFQSRQNGDLNGWWNPEGSGAFRLVGARVTGADSGEAAGADPAVGLHVAGNVDCAPAKLVDLDPQFQMGSMIWGLQMVLTDGTTEYLRGDYAPAPFRDLFFGRIATAAGSGGASAKFTSVLENLVWGEAAKGSPTLAALKALADKAGGRLSVSLTTIGYYSNAKSADFTLGLLVGAIGPWREGEPLFFPAARRFAPADGQGGATATLNLNFCDGWTDGRRVTIDLANCLPLQDRAGTVTDVGPLTLAMLRAPDKTTSSGGTTTIEAGTPQNAAVTPADYAVIGEIDYRAAGWLTATAGLASFDTDLGADLEDRPLALIADGPDGGKVVALRETIAGYFARADAFEQRADPGARPARLAVDIQARCFGRPLGGAPLVVALEPRQSGGGTGGSEPRPPKAPVPDINFPAAAIGLDGHGRYKTNKRGLAEVRISAADPGDPRDYIDGQIYMLDYGLAVAGASPMHALDKIVLHVREAFSGPASPQWSDVAPIFTQFANLYPVMSRRMFDFSDMATAAEKAKILRFALTRPIGDPNHMPVTRDLSAGKRRMLLAWLDKFAPQLPAETEAEAAAEAAEEAVAAYPPAPVGEARPEGRRVALQRLKGMSSERAEEEQAAREDARAAAPPAEGEI
ncbi:MAG: hypothetical protein JOZ90_16590 [Alphaproteobacteria bacterium]|nr:hypothetical protein [Alphaproteobacteria bacterium]MBV9371570.1 hypothetical protein [Alphaproteobacteria bacterium]MBV9902688.1 hypothetical protein [Alphaproteobacteria bacterium]